MVVRVQRIAPSASTTRYEFCPATPISGSPSPSKSAIVGGPIVVAAELLLPDHRAVVVLEAHLGRVRRRDDLAVRIAVEVADRHEPVLLRVRPDRVRPRVVERVPGDDLLLPVAIDVRRGAHHRRVPAAHVRALVPGARPVGAEADGRSVDAVRDPGAEEHFDRSVPVEIVQVHGTAVLLSIRVRRRHEPLDVARPPVERDEPPRGVRAAVVRRGDDDLGESVAVDVADRRRRRLGVMPVALFSSTGDCQNQLARRAVEREDAAVEVGDDDVRVVLIVHEPVPVVVGELADGRRHGHIARHAAVPLDDGLEAPEHTLLLAALVDGDSARGKPQLVTTRVGRSGRGRVVLRSGVAAFRRVVDPRVEVLVRAPETPQQEELHG